MIDVAERFSEEYPWGGEGQDLSPFPPSSHPWKRLVACLNVWNDINELQRTLPLWMEAVDAVIAVDGRYGATEHSTDGTLEYLARFPKVRVIPAAAWVNQGHKRTAYFADGQDGDLCWVVDADEYVEGADCLRSAPWLDVGWVTYRSPLYQRAQHTPRVFRWVPDLMYAKRHHWVHCGDRLMASHQEGGSGLVHRLLPLRFYNSRGPLRTEERQERIDREAQHRQEIQQGPAGLGHEPLRIVQVACYDAGMVVGRLHTAINTTSPHESAMVTPEHPFGAPQQYQSPRDLFPARDLLHTADVIHHHVTWTAWDDYGMDLRAKTNIIHHHGTMYRRHVAENNRLDADRGARLRLISNLELLQYGADLHFLPNPVPVGDYRMLRASLFTPRRISGRQRRWVIGHSPSRREMKGTEEFLRVCERLQAKGLPIEPLLIEKVTFAESLRLKARCDIFFDSFRFGLQCSGLEAAAMGQPVLAGDPECQKQYTRWLGYVPYTYANTEAELEAQLARLVTDADFRRKETATVGGYTLEHHDGANVVRTYLDLLDGAIHWREMLALRAA